MVFPLSAIYTCNLVAAYIIPSVFFIFSKAVAPLEKSSRIYLKVKFLVFIFVLPKFFSGKTNGFFTFCNLHMQFSRCLYNPQCFFHFLKILLGEANFRYTTTFSREYRTSVLNSLVFKLLVSPESHFRYTTIFSREFSTSVLN